MNTITLKKSLTLVIVTTFAGSSVLNAMPPKKDNGKTPIRVAQAGPSTQIQERESALHDATRKGDLSNMKQLIKDNANVNAKNTDGETPLHLAANSCNPAIAQALIDAGAQVDVQRTQDNATPLHIAARAGNSNTVNLLLDQCASINPLTKFGETPLVLAVENNHLGVVVALLGVKANIASRDFDLLDTAIYKCYSAIARALIKAGANVNAQPIGYTPLHLATFLGELKVVEALIEAGANIHTISIHGQTALSIAQDKGHHAIIKVLTEAAQEQAQRAQDSAHQNNLLAELID